MTAEGHAYDRLFFEYQRDGALASARSTVGILHKAIRITSVLDVGCGAGAWLKAHQEIGVADVLGLDGAYVDPSLLVIDARCFSAIDITQPFDLGRTFDLVQCLEVGEHIPQERSSTLIDNLTRHGRCILFSAATPGQGGKGHINEQPLDYWRALFAKRDYRPYDYLRPRVAELASIEWWYRYNSLLYFREDEPVPEVIAECALPAEAPTPDFYPLVMRARKAVLRSLPNSIVDRLAVYKHRAVVRRLRRKARTL